MFMNKKILAALLCTPLFGACVINGDDDTGADSGTDPTTSDSSTMTTTSPTTTMTSTESGETTVDPDSSSGGTEGSTSIGTTETETDTGGGEMGCFLACAEAVDCCGGDPACEEGLGTYPYNYACEADGTCSSPGCESSDDCGGKGLPDQVCVIADGFGSCGFVCETTDDCVAAGLATFVCEGDDGAGGLYCVAGPCEEDADCGGGKAGSDALTCEAGECVFFCNSDDDCEFIGGVCDTTAGTCGCADDAECGKGFTCAEI